MKKTLIYSDGKSEKFWTIEIDGNSFTVNFGKVGTSGQIQTKDFADEAACDKEAQKLINQKLKKGYVETAIDNSAPNADMSKKVAKEPVKTSAPKDVIDDGKTKAWHSYEFWKHGDYEEEYFENLHLSEAERNALEPDDNKKDANAEKLNSLMYKIGDTVKYESLDTLKNLFDEIWELNNNEKSVLNAKQKALTFLFGDLYTIYPKHLTTLQYLLDEGAEIEPFYEFLGDTSKPNAYESKLKKVRPLFKFFADEYLKDPRPERTNEIIETFFNQLYTKAAEATVEALRKLIVKIKESKGKKDSKFPNGKLPADVDEIYFVVDSGNAVYVYPGEVSAECSGLKDIGFYLLGKYAPSVFKPFLDKMIVDGEFDDITDSYLKLSLRVREHVTISEKFPVGTEADKAREKFRQQLDLVENGDDYEQIKKIMEYVVYTVVEGKGVITPSLERAVNILKRHLYSGVYLVEEEARRIINNSHIDDDIWQFERYKFMGLNGDPDFISNIRTMANEGYQPAIDLCHEMEITSTVNTRKKAKDDEKNFSVFSETDLFTETDTLIARAYSDGNVYIRFKVENEKAYSDALDYLNSLLAKGYSDVCDGYGLNVRFVAKPEFIKNAKSLPKTHTNAFFARAVAYENLHSKILSYIDRGMKLYDGYKDIDSIEACSVVGIFAAAALMLTDKKYLPLAQKLAENTDGEHEEQASFLADDIEKLYGITPETTPAIYDLSLSHDGYERGVPKAMMENPECLSALMAHYNSLTGTFKDHSFVSYVGYYDVRKHLKKIKSYFDKATNTDAKRIYVDFYNLYKGLASAHESNLGEDLTLDASAVAAPKDVTTEIFHENPPCVITKDEAKKRGITVTDPIKDACGCAFSPCAIKNPYILDYWIDNEEKRNQNKALTYSSWGIEPDGYGSWIIDLQGAPHHYGLIMFDKKKPVIMYGIFDYNDAITQLYKRSLENNPDVEKIRQSNIVMPCPPAEKTDITSPSYKHINAARGLYCKGRLVGTVVNLDKIEKSDVQYYPAALMMKAKIYKDFAQKSGVTRVTARKAIYEQLLQLSPEFKEYWEKELATL